MSQPAIAKLTPANLYDLKTYARERPEFRARVMAHKRDRRVQLGPHMTLLFEDRLTVHYQVQEMLRIEGIADPKGIAEELATYNPLIPDGSNWKATLLIEFADAAERQRRLAELRGVEHQIALSIAQQPPIVAIADEDMPRSDARKTSAVHFLRFEVSMAAAQEVRAGAAVRVSVDHPSYRHESTLDGRTRAALTQDLSG